MMKHPVKAIIFDLGNVLVDLDFSRAFGNFERLLGIEIGPGRQPQTITNAVLNFERGEISTAAFLAIFKSIKPGITEEQIIAAWNSIIIDLPGQRLAFLEEMRQHYPLYLLSNINTLHEDYLNVMLKRQYGIDNFPSAFFDKFFYSHHVGMRKPEPYIYDHVTERINISPANILFIDDVRENVEAALNHGWQAVQHDPGQDITRVFDDYIGNA